MTTVPENLKDDILQEIPHQQIPSVLEMLKKDWPASILIYNYIKNFWDWECKDSSRKCHVLIPHGSWECGTVILIVPYVCQLQQSLLQYSLYTVAVYSPPEDHGYLERVLCTTNWIDWENPSYILFPGMLPSHKEAVMAAVKFRRLRLPIHTTQCLAYWMPHGKAAQLTMRCPLEVYIGPLNESHLDTVISHWEYGSQETRALILNLLRLNTCLGLYLATNHQLVAWVLSTEYGVGVLHTIGTSSETRLRST
ncbi:unnamed protein product [Timema podura]|uniref:Uncharacterized protein n=1 Tax=Timema podura TaxID=61482 RepID=A0ABN7NNX1_TIMPD|nr:unnamed protein product [Timema podura]